MRTKIFGLLTIISSLLLAASAQAQTDWQLTDFHSDIHIQSSGQVKIVETLQVDFGSNAKHGIFRDIPVTYQDGQGHRTYTHIDVQSVQRDGQTEPYEVTRNQANLEIKIGSGNKTITGSHTYMLTYTATGILSGFPQYDELYWNVTGSAWPVDLQHTTATVTIEGTSFSQIACYEGPTGSADPCQQKKDGPATVQFTASRTLGPGEGLTVAVGYPKNVIPLLTVSPPKTMADVIANRLTWWVAVLTTVAGAGLILRRWAKYGRDPRLQRATIVAEYDPPGGLRPAEIGTLLDERADTKDISASIVDLAVRGYLVITEIPKKWLFGHTDYEFKRTDKPATELLSYEQLLLDKLFQDGSTVQMSDLKQSFYKDLANVKDAVYDDVVAKKLFVKNPKNVRAWNVGMAIILMVAGGAVVALGVRWLQEMIFGLGVGLIVTGLVAVIVARLMPQRTAEGRELLRQIEGYKLFVSGTEKYRQPYFENHNIFMDVLPYAMIFGVTDKLVKAFKDMGIEPPQPTWYIGPRPFSFVTFDQQLTTMNDSLSSAMASTPSGSGSGGGGSSGGGFGGGGGGSW